MNAITRELKFISILFKHPRRSISARSCACFLNDRVVLPTKTICRVIVNFDVDNLESHGPGSLNEFHGIAISVAHDWNNSYVTM